MPTESCKKNIEGMKPPTYCPGTICDEIQGDINDYCKHNGLGGDVPVPQNSSAGKCWCCCSCVALGTPIEVTAGFYRPIEAIERGTYVLATGGSMTEWQEEKVTDIGGIAPGVPLDFCYTAYFKLADGGQRIITSTADHLYLVPGGVLQPVQDLRPGEKVMQADGKTATVSAVIVGQFSGGVRNFSLGAFDPSKHPTDPYKGHLINTFNLVTADLAVQNAFYAGNVPTRLLAAVEPDLAPIGSAAFFEKFDTTFHQQVMRDPAQWPKGFKALAPALVNVPPSALAYFTAEQAADIQEKEGHQNLGNSEALANFKYLRAFFRGFYPDLYYVADWTNDTPNAWYFNSADQNYVVLSGGLLRLHTLGTSGLTTILTHLVAQSRGYTCTGSADYWGAARFLREVWFGELYLDYVERGYDEIAATFELVKPEHAQPDPANICSAPGLACRLQALKRAQAFKGVPECALPPPALAVSSASADGLDQVKVTFSAKVFRGSASFPDHYNIDKDVTVLKADVATDNLSVTLSVKGLRPATGYRVVVSGIVSESGQFLSPDHNSAEFKTE
ncbi:hypothetical protein KY49_6882 [Burkholderia sp. MSHR3999]|uniref:hypothetical protein n=1 Tax=Burkholderia sp. MSHR3999 TaxID=1542965 RepID=UPI0005B6ECF3|nr:hypothetical protein [Burkholderia sp. MSHR3999]KIP17324.1 hypothetical protein KY49_6882 [Burkholderia sp. MSHR3999]